MKKTCRNPQKDRCEVLGIIIPNAWDTDGKTTAWAISTYNEKLYLISTRNKIGKQLSEITGKKVKAYGNIKQSAGAADIMTITDFIVIDEMDLCD